MRTTTTWLMAALLGAGVSAQDEARLRKAITIEEAEHDLANAAKLYEALARADDGSSDVRTEAWLRLSRVYRRLGDVDGAAAALAAAVRGTGPAAIAARELSEAGEQDPGDDVSLRVLEQIAELRKGNPPRYLIWIGRPAVPLLVKVVDAEASDFEFVTRVTDVLLTIGGPEVDAWLDRARREYPVLKRRAIVAVGKRLSEALATEITESSKGRLRAFLEDPDAGIRRDVLQSLGSVITAHAVVGRMSDDDERVRLTAWSIVGNRNKWAQCVQDRSPEGRLELSEAVYAQLRARQPGIPVGHRDAVASVVFESTLMQTHAGREFLLRAFRDERVRELVVRPTSLAFHAAADEHVESLLLTARALGPIDGELTFVQKSVLSFYHQVGNRWRWTSRSVPVALELAELGYALDGKWFLNVAEPDHWTMLFERLDAVDVRTAHVLLYRSAERELPDSAFAPLRGWIERKMSTVEDPTGDDGNALHSAVNRAALFDTDAANAWSARFVTEELWKSEPPLPIAGRLRDAVILALVHGDSPSRREALRALVTWDGTSKQGAPTVRSFVLTHLARLGDEATIELYPRAYELGLKATAMPVLDDEGVFHPETVHTGFLWLWDDRLVAEKMPYLGYDEAQAVRIVELCVAAGTAEAWSHVDSINDSRMTDALRSMLRGHWRDCSDPDDRSGLVWKLRSPELVAEALTDPSPMVRWAAVDALVNSEDQSDVALVRANLDRLLTMARSDTDDVVGSIPYPLSLLGDPALFEPLTELLAHRSPDVRLRAVRAIATLAPDRAAEVLVPLLRDPKQKVQVEVCDAATATFDKRYVPTLIELLRDEDFGAVARRTLETIRVYHEEKARWERLLDDSGLGADNAAEALLKQVRESDQKRIRLVAIRSLGTLGVPETLPFLIQLMQDDDAEIATAASAAVDRINARSDGAGGEAGKE